MGLSRIAIFLSWAALLAWMGSAGYSQSPSGPSPRQAQSTATPHEGGKDPAPAVPVLPRGKKLILKDGSFQLTRDYQRTGDRVRYLSAERGEWEEIPAAMVDWDATAKAEAAAKSDEEALAKKVRVREQAQNLEPVMDVDASLQVGPGLFLPSGGEGMFVVDGKSVRLLAQAGSQVKTDKKQYLKQVLSPIPIIPGKHNVELPGARAKIRVTNGHAEFYLREAPPDPDRTTPIIRSSRPGESGPEVELVRATVKGDKRQLETIRTLFGQEEAARATVSIERWDVAPTVFRFTLGEPLLPGEYALAEILPDGMNLYVWDFGVDEPAPTMPASAKPKN